MVNQNNIYLPTFHIGDLEMNLIQGGMGVGISGKNLASAVANCGGAGIIASVGLGALNNSQINSGNYQEDNIISLREEIKAAREMSPEGVIGVNIMRALTDYESLVKAAVDENIDLIITGAGIDPKLPERLDGKDIKLVPIVSDVRAANLITRCWQRAGKSPDAFVVEGPLAGGHLGFKYRDLVKSDVPKLKDIAKDVIDFANDSKIFDKPVPIIVAGGIYTGADIRTALEYGATGVQMATRFVTTSECDASRAFKESYLSAEKEDIKIIKSPVGMPGRAIMNPFLERVMKGETIDFKCDYHCLIPCKPKESPYCIAEALIAAQQGKFGRGFAFAGKNAYRNTPETCLDKNGKFISVRTLMEGISDEYKK